MDTVAQFESKLMSLNPRSDSFVLDVDQLFESFPGKKESLLIPVIFRFFEKYPLEDCGAPGTLVHFAEQFYPDYKSILLESLAQVPSYNAILMVNRILNSKLSREEREEYLSALKSVAIRKDVHQSLIKEAEDFIKYQNKKHS